MSLRLLCWNVNGLRPRLPHLERVIDTTNPDVICLQETKLDDSIFPAEALTTAGYPHQAIWGMPQYNGVAILSRLPLGDIRRHPHADTDATPCRHISATLTPSDGPDPVTIHCLYVPAGGDIPDPEVNPRFAAKLDFLDRAGDWFAGSYGYDDRMILAGDFNVAPLPADVWDHRRMSRTMTHTPLEIAALERFRSALDWQDCLRRHMGEDVPAFTWWSYRAADYRESGKGRRLDHVWASRSMIGHVRDVEIFENTRGWDRPSDHVPVIVDFGI